MADPFIGEIRIFGGNFAPKNWALCQGQVLAISQNTALFSILGTAFGGDGIRTFGLPNLQGNAPMGTGNGPGLTPRVIGELGGSPTVALNQLEIPAHSHLVNVLESNATTNQPQGNVLATTSTNIAPYVTPDSNMTPLNPQTIATAGQSVPHNNMQPYLGMTFIIALQGIYPTRG